jgi:hypothetical protein
MSEPDYREVKVEEERRLLHSVVYWDLAAFGALVGAGLGFLYGLGEGSRQRAFDVFAGMVIGALVVFASGWAKAQFRARERFFARWAAKRQWAYEPSGEPFEDTPFLSSGDERRASDFFSGFWTVPGVVLYQHKRIIGSGRSEQVSTFIVLHFSLDRPLIDLLQIWPHSRSAELEEKLTGQRGEIGERVDLESTELMQCYRISGPREQEDEVAKLLTPSAIVKILDFHRSLPGANSYFEIQGMRVAFLVEKPLSPKRPELIEKLLELWEPLATWLIDEAAAANARAISSGEGTGAGLTETSESEPS